MKKHATIALLGGSLLLLAVLGWRHLQIKASLEEVSVAAMRGDEIHCEVHGISLAALESDDTEQKAMAIEILQMMVEAGEINASLRDRLGIER